MSEFVERDLAGARFTGCNLENAVVRGCVVDGMEIDSPWLLEEGAVLTVNGVDVTPYVEAELNRRFPGRELRQAETPDGLREAWAALERTWAATLDRGLSMPPGTVDESVAGEWSFAQTLRHLVMATDIWLGRAILERADPYHPLGLRHEDGDSAARDESTSPIRPAFEEVLSARADRQRMVRDHLAALTPDDLDRPRRNPHNPDHVKTELSCLRTILEEEWEHHRYVVRDLDALAGESVVPPT